MTRSPFWLLPFLLLVLNSLAAAAEPMLLTASAQGKTMDQAVAALNRAIVNNNYTFVRQQAIDSRLVPYAQEVRSVRLVYFCNFAKMDRALRLDPRASQMLPCRVTLVETPTGVDLIAVNPAWASQNLPGLHEPCRELKQDYLAILEEATL
ncbi:MAG: DUF302 domain-containing protein [Betaproteobacteria bacterium]|nr:DUF302 domain-containing protein [Betaproteobacteria bacterium]